MDKYQKIGKLYDYLTVNHRIPSGDVYYLWRDNTPENIKSWWQDITGKYNDYSFADLDEYYRVLYMLAGAITDNPEFNDNDLYSMEWQDIYNADRLDWLKENLNRAYLYEEVKHNGADGIFELIGDMQDFNRAELAQYILNNIDGLGV